MKKRIAVATAATCCILVSGAGFAAASAHETTSTRQESRAVLIEGSEGISIPASHTHEEILQLLLAGQGPIAEANPDLVRMLGFAEDKPHTDEEALAQVIGQYLAFESDFDEKVARPITSGDPQKVNEALTAFSKSFMDFVGAEAEKPGNAAPQDSGWLYQGAYVAIYANAVGVANAVGYANVGVATFALATLAVTWFYLEDEDPAMSGFERDQVVGQVTEALAA
ncbi:hypothetical protein [Streptomyces pratensis]|uniref:hypothetical protein n=1 Tax=Streptomyces pratensis TaxID=1169025 RepID=UPI00301AB9E7